MKNIDVNTVFIREAQHKEYSPLVQHKLQSENYNPLMHAYSVLYNSFTENITLIILYICDVYMYVSMFIFSPWVQISIPAHTELLS